MPYCEIADVQSLNAQRTPYSAGTKPTNTQVEMFIATIFGQLNTALSAAGLTVPVAEPADFVTALKWLNTVGAAAMAELAQFPEADRGQGNTPQGDRYWEMYQDGLKAIADGSGIHNDAPRATTTAERWTVFALGTAN